MRTREIEQKLIVKGSSLEDVNVLMRHFCSKSTKSVYGYSKDTYWHTQIYKTFVRMRERDGIRQLTVKSEDRGDSLNRLEIDLDCTSPTSLISEFNKALFGRQAGVVEKKYYVYWLGEGLTICCYQCTVDGELKPEIVIEVEGETEEEVAAYSDKLIQFYSIGMTIEKASGSLYHMYLEEKGLKELPHNPEYDYRRYDK